MVYEVIVPYMKIIKCSIAAIDYTILADTSKIGTFDQNCGGLGKRLGLFSFPSLPCTFPAHFVNILKLFLFYKKTTLEGQL
jgi:hypothetical protein